MGRGCVGRGGENPDLCKLIKMNTHLQVEKLGVRRVLVGQNEVLEGNGRGGAGAEPALAGGADNILRRQRLEDGDGEGQCLVALGLVTRAHVLGVHLVELGVVDVLVLGILDPDPPRLGLAVHLHVPLEQRLNHQRHPQHGPRNGLDRRMQLQVRKRVHNFLERRWGGGLLLVGNTPNLCPQRDRNKP